MKISKFKKAILIFYAIAIIILCVFSLPNKMYLYNNHLTKYDYPLYKRYPIWADICNYGGENEYAKNFIDYSHLVVEVFTVTVVCGVLYIISDNKDVHS